MAAVLIQTICISIVQGNGETNDIEFRLDSNASPDNIDVYIGDDYQGSVALEDLKALCKKILEVFGEA